jgi:hypothetical protein
MKNTDITLQNEQGETITINNQTLMGMITKQMLHHKRMIEKQHNNPHLTKEELKEGVMFDTEQIDFMNTLLGFCNR